MQKVKWSFFTFTLFPSPRWVLNVFYVSETAVCGCFKHPYLLSFWQFELILRPLGGSRNSVICGSFLKSHQKIRIWPVVQSEASLLNPNSSHIMSDKKSDCPERVWAPKKSPCWCSGCIHRLVVKSASWLSADSIDIPAGKQGLETSIISLATLGSRVTAFDWGDGVRKQ